MYNLVHFITVSSLKLAFSAFFDRQDSSNITACFEKEAHVKRFEEQAQEYKKLAKGQ